MSFRETSHVAQGPFGSPDPVRDLRGYFELNGYETVHEVLGARPDAMTWKSSLERDESVDGEAAAAAEGEDEGTPSASDEEAGADSHADDDEEEAPESNDADARVTAEDEAENLSSSAPAGEDLAANVVTHLRMRRGEKGASLWTSNMAELLADVEVKLIGDTIRIAYKIEDTLQHFNDDDEAFWAHEAQQAIRVATGKGRPIDWRENEDIRVGRQQKDIIMIGVQLAFVAAVLVAIGFFAFAGR